MAEALTERVDPQFRKILKVINGPAYTPVHQLTPTEARAQAEHFFQAPAVEVVGLQRDLVAETAVGSISCRLYHPSPGVRLPLLIYYHGGGWVFGSVDTAHGVTASLAGRSGCAVLSVDYRLAPEHPFPAAVDDAFAILRWASDAGDELEIDETRIALGGDSAGANLATVVAILAREAGGPPVCFQLLVYPVTDATCRTASMDRFDKGCLLEKKDMLWYWNHYCPDQSLRETDVRASPLRLADAVGLPPAYLLLAEFDPLVDEGLAYAERLRGSEVAVTCRVVPAAIHAFLDFWQIAELADRELSAAAEALAAELCPPI